MKFANPFYFLLIIPAFIFFFLYIRSIISKEATLRFSNLSLIKEAGGKRVAFGRFFNGLLRLLSVLLIICAIARPQTSTGEEKSTEHVVDIMIALDISGSMATLDFHPDNRLIAAKAEAKKFIEGRAHDRIGLVVFAGQSLTQCPLTVDRTAILTLLERTQMGILEDGTAIGLGLANAVNRLKDSAAKSRVVILLTDGVNNAGEIDPITAAELAKRYNIRVYTIGVGKEGESFLPINDPRFGPRLVRVETQIDEKTLSRISSMTSGKYFRAQDSRGLQDIFKEIDKLEKTEIIVDKYVYYEERYFWFLWPAFLIFLFEIFWINLVRVKIP